MQRTKKYCDKKTRSRKLEIGKKVLLQLSNPKQTETYKDVDINYVLDNKQKEALSQLPERMWRYIF